MNADEVSDNTVTLPGADPGTAARRGTRPSRQLLRRVGWGLGDQVLSSVTNFALTLFVAALLTPTQFGAFSVVIAVYGTFLGISAGFAASPLVVRYSAAVPAVQRVAKL